MKFGTPRRGASSQVSYFTVMAYSILVPLDGSVESENALSYARALASRLQARVELVRSFEPPAALYGLPQLEHLGEEVLSDYRLEQMVREYLESKGEELAPLPWEARVERGSPAKAILERSQEHDMILMSRHGREGVRWRLGGVAAKVVRGSKKPVLVVPTSSEKALRIKTILVGLDGSASAERALDKAIELAKATEANLVLYRFVPVVYDADLLQLELERAKVYVAELAQVHGDTVKGTLVRSTNGHSDIVECAQELEADLIVLGTHGHRGVTRWLLGSVAEDAIYHAHTPTLVVP